MKNLILSLLLIVHPMNDTTYNDDLTLTYKENAVATINHDAFTSNLIDIPLVNETMFEQLLVKLEQQINVEPTNA